RRGRTVVIGLRFLSVVLRFFALLISESSSFAERVFRSIAMLSPIILRGGAGMRRINDHNRRDVARPLFRVAVLIIRGMPARRPAMILSGVRGLRVPGGRSEEHTSELQSREELVCRLLLEKKNS